MKPRAKKKANAISQGIGSPKAEKAAAKVKDGAERERLGDDPDDRGQEDRQ